MLLTKPTPESTMNLSFCGSGFLGIYHIGVVKALSSHAPEFLSKMQRIGGASAGALIGAMLVCAPTKLATCMQFCLDLSDDVRKKRFGALTPNFNLLDSVRLFLEAQLPTDSFKKADGVLHISLTKWSRWRVPESEIASRYSSNADLTQRLVASCFIPVYAGVHLPIFNGEYYADGGLLNNLIIFQEGRTVTVSPFCGGQDICPVDPPGLNLHVKLKNQTFRFNGLNGRRARHAVFPPTRDVLEQYYKQGFSDAINFLKKEHIYET